MTVKTLAFLAFFVLFFTGVIAFGSVIVMAYQRNHGIELAWTISILYGIALSIMAGVINSLDSINTKIQ